MTKKEKIELARALKTKARILAKDDYYEYVKYVHDDFEELDHVKHICKTIDKAIKKRQQMLDKLIPMANQYLMFNLPPRHGKSMTITETLPSYFMAKFDKSKSIMTAYNITLADDFARANAKKVSEKPVFDGLSVSSNNQDRMTLSNGSVCVKAGILGGITGKGAELMIIDDPIKTQEEASSETTREKIWKEWQSSLSTRLEKAAIVILIMTRWHEDDLAGRLLSAEHGDPLPWEVVNIPLEAEENDVLGRQVGEPLWAERYGFDFIKERKQYPQTFNALYQGRPTSEQGNMLKRSYWQYYDVLPNCPVLCMSVDATFKDTAKSDKVSIQVWGKTNLDYYLIDRINARMDFTTTLQAIRNFKAKYPSIGMIFIEDKANGSAIINVLQKEITGIVPVNPQGGKESRAQAILPYVVGGNVHLPRTEWISDFVEECASFPKGAHDDDVDSMTQAINMINSYYAGPIKPNEKYEDNSYIDEFNMW